MDKIDAKVKEHIPNNPQLHNWLDMARERIQFQGLPSRICWVGLGERARLGLAFNEMVASGEVSAPLVIGRDHLDSGSVASPNRETEGMMDGSDALPRWLRCSNSNNHRYSPTPHDDQVADTRKIRSVRRHAGARRRLGQHWRKTSLLATCHS